MVNALGVDVGGSKTSAVLVDVSAPATPLAHVTVGSANHQTVGREGAEHAVAELVAALARQSGSATVDSAFVGAAGADTQAAQERVRQMFVRALPGTEPARVHAAHDTAILLAAGHAEQGCVLICGTGSAAWARNRDGRDARAGGWGPMLGDEGSGFNVARGALRATLARADDGAPIDALGEAVLAHVGVEHPLDLLDAFYSDPDRARWARLARIVVDLAARDDAAANVIVAENLDALAHIAHQCCTRTGVRGPVILCGGLIQNVPLLAQRLRARLGELGYPDVQVLDRDPVWGAVDLACAIRSSPPEAP